MIIFILSCALILIGVAVPTLPFVRPMGIKASDRNSLLDVTQELENRWNGIQAEIQHLRLERELGYLDDRQYRIELQQQRVAVSEMLEDCRPWEHIDSPIEAIAELEIIATRLRIETRGGGTCDVCSGILNTDVRLCPNCGATVPS